MFKTKQDRINELKEKACIALCGMLTGALLLFTLLLA